MKGVLAAVAVAIVFAGGVRADEKEKDKEKKFDAAKLLGKWELSKSEDENAPKGAIIEFAKDNKLTITIEAGGKKIELGGTYKLDGEKLTVKIKAPDGGKEEEDTDTVKSITDEKIVLLDKKGKTTELTKKK